MENEDHLMAANLRVIDAHLGSGKQRRNAGLDLRLASERVSAREIIRSRVAAEVEEIKLRKQKSGHSYIIARAASERELNVIGAHGQGKATSLDVEAEVANAVAAFSRRRFIMLLDGFQIDDLDHMVGLRPESEVVFVHLLPLKGG
jgi:hypothetical protein